MKGKSKLKINVSLSTTTVALLLLLAFMAFSNFGRSRGPYMLEGFSGNMLQGADLGKNEKPKCKAGEKQIVLFSMNSCPHCKNIMPKWEDYLKKLPNGMNAKHYEVNKHPNVCETYGINGFPSFRLLDHNGEVLSSERPF
tara:strand:- start:240 stop:659 length:420 start_codon:yes stop_codon:yes gene_type:complete